MNGIDFDNNYLLTGHLIDRQNKLYSWYVYDLNENYTTYNANKTFNQLENKKITTEGNLLYAYSMPNESEMESCNGIVEIFELNFVQ